jgi:filamentous hemagglutinin
MTVQAADLNIIGNLSVTGNASLTGNIAADFIFNGTTSVAIPSPNGNVNVTVGGVSNLAVFSTGGLDVAGAFTATGNIVGANIATSGTFSVAGNIDSANLNTTGNVQITRDASVGQPTIRFTDTDTAIADSQVLGAVEWFTTNGSGSGPRITSAIRSIASSTLGNANVQILTSTNGAAATAKVTVLSTGNVGIGNVAPVDLLTVQGTIYGSSTATIIGNVTGGNLLTAGSATAIGNIQGGNLRTAGLVSATGNIDGGNIISAGFLGAGAAGISTVGNITGGNINLVARVSATGNVLGDTITAATAFSTVGNVSAGNISTTANTATANLSVSTRMSGTGIGVENIVYQSTDATLSSATPETIGVLEFPALANQAYQFDAYIVLVPVGATTVAPAVNFSSGTCAYTTQLQTTSTSAFDTATKTASDDVATTYSSTGTDARTLRISGYFAHTGNVTVSMRFQTSAANITVKTGSYLSYTRTN